MNRGERKVPFTTAVLITGIAFAFDLINIILEYLTFGVGGFVMDMVSTITFSLWLERYGIHLWNNKNAGWTLLTAFIDALPVGDLFFPWTIRVGRLVFTEREDLPPQIDGRSVQGLWRL